MSIMMMLLLHFSPRPSDEMPGGGERRAEQSEPGSVPREQGWDEMERGCQDAPRVTLVTSTF